MSERAQPNRWRCLVVGCNPVLLSEADAGTHVDIFGSSHRVAKWPVRSKDGQRRARARNRSGYYDKYNVGAKSPQARFAGSYPHSDTDPEGWDGHKDERP
jgi:hypothetical protein